MTREEGRKRLLQAVEKESLAYILGAAVGFVQNFGDDMEKRLANAASAGFEAEIAKIRAEQKGSP